MSFMPAVAGFPRPYLAPPQAGEVDWSDVLVLLSAEGKTVGTSAFANHADKPVISWRVGTTIPTVTDAFSPFPGGRSFNHNVMDGIRVRGASLATGPFTVEGWGYGASWSSSTSVRTIVSAYTDVGNSWEFVQVSSVLRVRWIDPVTLAESVDSFNAPLPPLNTWFHWALERNAAGKLRLYIDGVMVGSAQALAFRDVTPHFAFSNNNGGGGTGYLRGYAAEMRVSQVAVYDSDAGFTPRTTPFPRGAGAGDPHYDSVVWLSADHHAAEGLAPQVLDRSPHGGRFTTLSGTTFTEANQRGGRVGDLKTDTFTSYGRQAQGVLLPQMNFYDRTVPFTAECFIRPDSSGVLSHKNIMGIWSGSTGTLGRQWLLQLNVGRPHLYLSTDGSTATHNAGPGSVTLVAGTWYHIALTRTVSGTYKVFVNGVLAVTLADPGVNLFDNSAIASPIFYWTGASGTGSAFTGQMHGLRITKGVDRYHDTDGFVTEIQTQVLPVGTFPAYAA
jgi:hypothetical protein